MKNLMAAVAVAVLLAPLPADAQTSTRIRGTITAYDGKVLSVRSREGKDLQLKMAPDATVAYPKAITLADLKPGDYVGTTSTRNSDGRLVAREVHTIPKTAAEGHRPSDLEPGSTMTNANIARTVKATSGHELTLEYKGGSQTILVPDGTPIVTSQPGDKSLLVPGTYVFVTAAVAADGSMTAQRIQAAKDGVRPPQ